MKKKKVSRPVKRRVNLKRKEEDKDEEGVSDEEEEKRLWLVSLSRARKMIYFCCPLFLELSHYKTLQKKTQNVEICDEHPKKVHSNKRINFFILTKNDLFEKNI